MYSLIIRCVALTSRALCGCIESPSNLKSCVMGCLSFRNNLHMSVCYNTNNEFMFKLNVTYLKSSVPSAKSLIMQIYHIPIFFTCLHLTYRVCIFVSSSLEKIVTIHSYINIALTEINLYTINFMKNYLKTFFPLRVCTILL